MPRLTVIAAVMIALAGFPCTLFSASLPYYSPGLGTQDIVSGYNPEKITLTGEPLPAPVMVMSRMGQRYQMIGPRGEILFSKNVPVAFKMGQDNKYFYVPSAGKILLVDKYTGDVPHTLETGSTVGFANMVDKKMVTAVFSEKTNVQVWDMTDPANAKVIYVDPNTSSYPRSADMQNGVLAVADTFGQRVYGVNMATGKMEFSIPSYYPNHVLFVAPQTLLITAEHTNRVLEYNIKSKERRIIFGCPYVFTDPRIYNTEEVKKMEIQLIAHDSRKTPPESRCSETIAGHKTLYSPNGARKFKDMYVIVDSDNHRVLVVKNGEILSTLRGFNTPVDAMFVDNH